MDNFEHTQLADAAINYKAKDFEKLLEDATPNFVDE